MSKARHLTRREVERLLDDALTADDLLADMVYALADLIRLHASIQADRKEAWNQVERVLRAGGRNE